MALFLLQKLADLAKVGAIKLADKINNRLDPFDEFTRKAILPYAETLAVKAQKFEQDFVSRFSAFDGAMWEYRICTDPAANDEGDQCIWHGLYTAMWAFKYAATGDPTALERLRLSMKGMDMHQTAHGEPVRRLIRGVKKNADDSLFVRDDVSNDSATGHICGIYFAWLYGDDDVKKKAGILAEGIAQELINHNYALIGKDGNPTEFGALIQGVLTDPLRLALCLTIFKVASKITGAPIYEQHYQKIEKAYNAGCLAAYAKVKLGTFDTKYDSHRAAIFLTILSDLETNSGLKADYKAGLMRTWGLVKKTGNTWIAYLLARHFPLTPTEEQQAQIVLSEFTLENKAAGNIERVNSNRGDELRPYGVKIFQYGGKPVSSQPLPRWWVASQDFYWQRDLMSADDSKGVTTPNTFHNLGDFLVAYWLGRTLKIISPQE